MEATVAFDPMDQYQREILPWVFTYLADASGFDCWADAETIQVTVFPESTADWIQGTWSYPSRPRFRVRSVSFGGEFTEDFYFGPDGDLYSSEQPSAPTLIRAQVPSFEALR